MLDTDPVRPDMSHRPSAHVFLIHSIIYRVVVNLALCGDKEWMRWAEVIQRPIVGMVTAGLFNVASSAFHWEVTVLIWV